MAYLTVTEVESGLSALANTYPALTSLVTLPNNTHEGRTCHALRIGTGSAGTKDGILFIGGVRPGVGFLRNLHQFRRRHAGSFYQGNWLGLWRQIFHRQPSSRHCRGFARLRLSLVNPDGRHHSQTVVPMWRRNRNPADSGGNPDCVGVDVNRNYDWLWDFPNKFSPDAIVRVSTDPCELGVVR